MESRDRKTYRKVTRMHIYTVKILPTQVWARSTGGERRVLCGAAVFRAFEVGQCDVGDPRVMRIGARRGVCSRKRRSGSNVGGKGKFGGKARRNRARPSVAGYCGSGGSRGQIVPFVPRLQRMLNLQ